MTGRYRNEPCRCKSGRKFKHCCQVKVRKADKIRRVMLHTPWPS